MFSFPPQGFLSMELAYGFSLPTGLKQCSSEEDFKNVNMEATKQIKYNCSKSCSLPFTTFYWVKQVTRAAHIQGLKNQTHHLMREVVKSHYRRHAIWKI